MPGSFRDPSGFVFLRDGAYHRHVGEAYREDYERLMASGLYRELVDAGALIPHDEAPMQPEDSGTAFRILKPETIPFISYPYEWCFGQLRDAALLTLDIQARAMARGMILKDASAYNIQFLRGRPVLMDTLSFARMREGEPWIAYRQFCQHFLAPLALMAGKDSRLGGLARNHIDGVPLDLAASLLPWSTRLRPGLAMHVHLHARSQRAFANPGVRSAAATAATGSKGRMRMGPGALAGLVASLRGAVAGLAWRKRASTWGGYYCDNSYSGTAMEAKRRIVASILDSLRPASLWDLGANNGAFSRLATAAGIPTIAFDSDHEAVQDNYLACKSAGETRMLPLIMDLANPSPGLGWAHGERLSMLERGPAEACLALALIHHIVIGNHIPFAKAAGFLRAACRTLVIEFVPESDPQALRLLAAVRGDAHAYHERAFLEAFAKRFAVKAVHSVPESGRKIFVMEGLPA